jgi:alpha-methylacyl-CoA racemase
MTSEHGPLSGVRIVELASIGPAPFCGMMLADMGAEVIRVDRVGAANAAIEFQPRFDVLGRGRQSLRVDLKSARGKEVVLKLVKESDALIEGYRPGVLERLSLGPEQLWESNPALIVGRMTGWGQDGPMSQIAGHDINYVALSGALFNIGERGGPPVPPLNLVGDFGGGGLLLAFGLLCAIIEAKHSGRGQVVDAAMVDGAAVLTAGVHAMMAQGEFKEGRGESILSGGAPFYGTFECQDGEYISIGALEPPFYAEMVSLLELDPNLFADRSQNRWPEQRQIIAAQFKQRTREYWCELLELKNVCFAPVLSMNEAPEHHHNRSRGTFISVNGLTQPAPAPRFSRTTTGEPSGAPVHGADTAAILRTLGYSDGDLKELIEAGAIALTD